MPRYVQPSAQPVIIFNANCVPATIPPPTLRKTRQRSLADSAAGQDAENNLRGAPGGKAAGVPPRAKIAARAGAKYITDPSAGSSSRPIFSAQCTIAVLLFSLLHSLQDAMQLVCM